MKRLSAVAVQSEAAVYRFLAEAQIASQLDHPGILPVFDIGLDPDGRPFYTTQLLPGTTLQDIWNERHQGRRSEWTLRQALRLLLHVCDVMAHAHSRGVIHRDLKPSNILVGAFGDVRVIDWGSARILDSTRAQFEEPFVSLNPPGIETERDEVTSAYSESSISTGSAGGPLTPLFVPPEVLNGGSAQVSPQTDIYAMGVMLYRLLAGRWPYSDGRDTMPAPDVLRGLASHSSPRPVREVNPRVSRDLAAICGKAMAPSLSERYGQMLEFASDLRAFLEIRPVQARRSGPLLKAQKFAQRNAGQVLLGGTALLMVLMVVAVARGLKAERDAERQITALRSAELSAGTGQWREALRFWSEAEIAGYNDEIDLAMRRAEAWTALASPRRARAELNKLLEHSDLRQHQAIVLLRLGEHDLFEKANHERGAARVGQALTLGLTGADEPFARGLVAPSTIEALELFRAALRMDSRHRGAHRHSLGLEFVLGQYRELESHLDVFKQFFPDDPASGFIEAAALATRGRGDEAAALLDRMPVASNAEERKQFESGLRVLAATAEDYDVEVLLGERPAARGARESFAAATADPFYGGVGTRVPKLPCIQNYREGWKAAATFTLPLFADPQPAVEQIKVSWRSHPEALLPVVSATLLEKFVIAGASSIPLLETQAELFQLGADSPSVFPKLPRFARWLAAKAQFQLARGSSTNSSIARQQCVDNIRRGSVTDETSAAECRAYFELAFDLEEFDLARALLAKWQRLRPSDAAAEQSRIRLELAVGALDSAHALIERLLIRNPGDEWAIQHRDTLKKMLNELIDSLRAKPTLQP